MKAIVNARVFDGKNPLLKEHCTIIIDENKVKEITCEKVNTDGFDQVTDAGNRVVLPGLVDSHVHLSFVYNPPRMDTVTLDQVAVRETVFAREMLMRGFTTVRDAGGCVYGLKCGIDDGFVSGPRIYPSYAGLSQTCGHGDFRTNRAELKDSPHLRLGDMILADGVPAVLKAARDQLFMGASQIKIMASGGMLSPFDPLFGIEYTLDEMKAAVSVAKNYGTYVMAHIYSNDAMKQAADAGVLSFEHATMLEEDVAKQIKDMGAWITPGPQFSIPDNNKLPESKLELRRQLTEGEEKQTELINKYDIPILFGTDLLRDEDNLNATKQLGDLKFFKKRFGSFKGLVSATGNAYEVIKHTTMMNPYPEGKIGVLEKGSFADLLIVNGNPLEDLDILADEVNIRLIMKDATIYKNTL